MIAEVCLRNETPFYAVQSTAQDMCDLALWHLRSGLDVRLMADCETPSIRLDTAPWNGAGPWREHVGYLNSHFGGEAVKPWETIN